MQNSAMCSNRRKKDAGESKGKQKATEYRKVKQTIPAPFFRRAAGCYLNLPRSDSYRIGLN